MTFDQIAATLADGEYLAHGGQHPRTYRFRVGKGRVDPFSVSAEDGGPFTPPSLKQWVPEDIAPAPPRPRSEADNIAREAMGDPSWITGW